MISLLARLFLRKKDPADLRRGYGMLCGAVGIGLNLLLFGGKFLAGTLSGSIDMKILPRPVTIAVEDSYKIASTADPEFTGAIVEGHTMDWKEDIMSNIYVFPRGMQRAGHNKEKTVNWTSKYGSVIATGYDIGTCDGMNEKGLVASLLFLPESVYSLPGDTRPAMGLFLYF